MTKTTKRQIGGLIAIVLASIILSFLIAPSWVGTRADLIKNYSINKLKDVKQLVKRKHISNPIGRFIKGPDMHVARYKHTATLLDDGNVLIAGGYQVGTLRKLKTAELYLTKENKFIQIQGLNEPRVHHAAVTINNGKVLFFGGSGSTVDKKTHSDATDIIEEYDPATQKFRIVGKMLDKRWRCKVVELDDGRIFIYGGAGPKSKGQWHCELYDSKTNTSTYTSKMHYWGIRNSMTKLSDGRVFMNIGTVLTPEEDMNKIKVDDKMKINRKGAVELYDFKTNEYIVNHILPPHNGSLFRSLPANKVLILAQQIFDRSSHEKKYEALILDVDNMKTTSISEIQIMNPSHQMPMIKERYVLVSGINKDKTATFAEFVDVEDNKIIKIGELNILRVAYTATTLSDGNILIAGGRHKQSGKKTKQSEIFVVNQ